MMNNALRSLSINLLKYRSSKKNLKLQDSVYITSKKSSMKTNKTSLSCIQNQEEIQKLINFKHYCFAAIDDTVKTFWESPYLAAYYSTGTYFEYEGHTHDIKNVFDYVIKKYLSEYSLLRKAVFFRIIGKPLPAEVLNSLYVNYRKGFYKQELPLYNAIVSNEYLDILKLVLDANKDKQEEIEQDIIRGLANATSIGHRKNSK